MPVQYLHGVEVVQIDDGIRPIRTLKSSIIGLVGTAPDADAAKFPVDTPVLLTGPRAAALLGDDGTLSDAYSAVYAQGVNVAVVVRVEEGATAAETLAAVAGDVAEQTGVFALTLAKTVTGQQPRILAAPGFTSPDDPAVKNPVANNLDTVAARLRAVAVIDGPNSNEADAITYADLWGSDRVYLVEPFVRVYDNDTATSVTRPASAYVAGVISATDAAKGFWHSPSNKLIEGIETVARPIGFGLSDPDTEANRMNEAKVATIVREEGFRLWGDRSTASDPLWAFLSVRRTADIIYDSVERGHLWAIDRPFSQQLLIDLREGVQAYLETLISLGAILGGRVWLDPELNTETTLKAGQLYLDFDIEPAAPLEHLTFRAHRNGSYYEELVAGVNATQ